MPAILFRVRGVPGVRYAVRLFKGTPVARAPDGVFSQTIALGLDDATLAGAPRKMLLGSWERLREPDSIVIDKAGYVLLFPGQPLELGRTLELNDHKVTHDTRVFHFADTIAHMDDGRILKTESHEKHSPSNHRCRRASF